MKKIVILAFLLLLTGCTAEYNISINEDLSISETAYCYGDSDMFDTYYMTTRSNVLGEILDVYTDGLKENGYEYELMEGTNPYVVLSRKYSDIGDYVNKTILLNDYFDEIKYTKNGDILKIETVGFHPNEENDPNRFYITNLDIAITSSYKVINHNATKIDDNTNTYHFEIKEDTEDFKIILELDTTKKFNPLEKTYLTIIITVLIIIAAWIMVFVLNKKKK